MIFYGNTFQQLPGFVYHDHLLCRVPLRYPERSLVRYCPQRHQVGNQRTSDTGLLGKLSAAMLCP